LRLCNAYLLDDQERLGRWLIALAALAALAWLAQVAWWLVRREAQGQALTQSEAPARENSTDGNGSRFIKF
ncbi:MAG: hypothetical protein LWW82_05460, partial [Comamonadaceae bacterium]|nr:hypothetical protein [Comamonadaceae bacterium]